MVVATVDEHNLGTLAAAAAHAAHLEGGVQQRAKPARIAAGSNTLRPPNITGRITAAACAQSTCRRWGHSVTTIAASAPSTAAPGLA
ncbi:hypothetical protein [Nonomuraea montanisoli]|uniref:hypothetical protein n=1 Tax=Nonomuraea montanisoli TaxID=2741721 RepID=UPI001F181FD8|nr:hypothetical protein [Nonomuraea montanisoli]